ncbi:MAG TPA: hypothetical protein PL128_12515, partial [Ginsengibacter sp.]|nr:hypothetical protein [Ginsengibacter sp.]
MRSFHFSKFNPDENQQSTFEKLLNVFMQLLNYTSGDAGEALSWLTELDKQYNLSTEEYGMGDFIDELKEKGYIEENNPKGEIRITPKTERTIRRNS